MTSPSQPQPYSVQRCFAAHFRHNSICVKGCQQSQDCLSISRYISNHFVTTSLLQPITLATDKPSAFKRQLWSIWTKTFLLSSFWLTHFPSSHALLQTDRPRLALPSEAVETVPCQVFQIITQFGLNILRRSWMTSTHMFAAELYHTHAIATLILVCSMLLKFAAHWVFLSKFIHGLRHSVIIPQIQCLSSNWSTFLPLLYIRHTGTLPEHSSHLKNYKAT